MKKIYTPFVLIAFFLACSDSEDPISYKVNQVSSFLGVVQSNSPIDSDVSFFKNVSYGNKERNKLDLFLPNEGPINGFVIFFHGGSFQFGSKEDLYDDRFNYILKSVLNNKIGVANAEYSFITESHSKGVFTSLTDGAKAINFIRQNSSTLRVPKNKLVLAGVSAGAGIAQWNGFREETNSEIKGIVALYAQSTYDLNKWEDIFYQFNLDSVREVNTEIEDMFTQFYGGEYTTKKALALDFISEIDADDPSLYVYNPVYEDDIFYRDSLDLNVLFHSFKHADLLRKKATEVGLNYSGAYQEFPEAFIKRILIDK